MPDFPPYDSYAEHPSFYQKNPGLVWAAAVFVLTVVLTVLSFPPYNKAEFAYAFAGPALFWAYERPRFKPYALTLFAAQAVAWTIFARLAAPCDLAGAVVTWAVHGRVDRLVVSRCMVGFASDARPAGTAAPARDAWPRRMVGAYRVVAHLVPGRISVAAAGGEPVAAQCGAANRSMDRRVGRVVYPDRF